MKIFAPIFYVLKSDFLHFDETNYLNQLFQLVNLVELLSGVKSNSMKDADKSSPWVKETGNKGGQKL